MYATTSSARMDHTQVTFNTCEVNMIPGVSDSVTYFPISVIVQRAAARDMATLMICQLRRLDCVLQEETGNIRIFQICRSACFLSLLVLDHCVG